ncbi:uncharacterized protein LOC143775204 isoform X2 [Ranitomeya variabilis]|uniref:uncharacterized protein LOC143775204 isoform X2 n=1 Tax=Ranitomeya variabilis TaxID=490064 RepID=UPI004057BADB
MAEPPPASEMPLPSAQCRLRACEEGASSGTAKILCYSAVLAGRAMHAGACSLLGALLYEACREQELQFPRGCVETMGIEHSACVGSVNITPEETLRRLAFCVKLLPSPLHKMERLMPTSPAAQRKHLPRHEYEEQPTPSRRCRSQNKKHGQCWLKNCVWTWMKMKNNRKQKRRKKRRKSSRSELRSTPEKKARRSTRIRVTRSKKFVK